jgi:ketosteroid isomerase-like protein
MVEPPHAAVLGDRRLHAIDFVPIGQQTLRSGNPTLERLMSESTEAWVVAGVRAVLGAHTQAQDAGRTDDIVALYTSDGALEAPGFGTIEGHDALREAFTGWAPTQPQLHLVSNTAVTSWTEDEATAKSDVAFLQRGESGWAVRIVGHYEDTLRRDGDGWLLHRRKTTYQA